MEKVPLPSPSELSPRAWYGATISEFLREAASSVLGQIASKTDFAVLETQRNAWLKQIEILQADLIGLSGAIFFEFNIPRMGRRIDVVLLIGAAVFVIEFKTNEEEFNRAALDQVWDYALDLKNFHEASHLAVVVPVLIATEASGSDVVQFVAAADNVYQPVAVGPAQLRQLVATVINRVEGGAIEHAQWGQSIYRPTPTIVEAARSLYAQHSVDAIACYDAGKKNLRETSRRVEELVDEAREKKQKYICFVTGVPGAGKTLVGLNVATRRRSEAEPTHAVFLSGNGPLVAVLREALTRDEVARRRGRKEKGVKKGRVGESVKAFIQNVHHFRDDALATSKPPVERVVIFDEAQRAWNLAQTASFMQRKKGRSGFSQSEPEFLISFMDRHNDWAVVICLVGGGQEINTGEAGIQAWLDAVRLKFPHWKMYISAMLGDSEYAAGKALDVARQQSATVFDDRLHLSVSMRSFRAENVSAFVKALIDCESRAAREALSKMTRFPVFVTRKLDRAKLWVRQQARGSERFGVVASSKAQRLKPHAIDIRVNVDPVHWFLNGKDDTRSSYYLEDAATEFQVQGLELDWVCVSWDGDFRFDGEKWSHHDFRGNKWTNVNKSENQNYLRNAYRVLLTRARQGMVIFVPEGDLEDPTRAPEFYDSTYNYLRHVGVPDLS